LGRSNPAYDLARARPEAGELAKLYALVAPNYAAVIESYVKAQEAARKPQ
jgi:hypothetical protein